MSTRKSLIIAAVAACTFAVPALAEEQESLIPGEVTGTVALTSDYRFRGVSQTDKTAAVQASLTYAVETGFHDTSVYAGFWGSNVDFNDGDEAQVEIDWLFGVRGKIGEVSWDLGGVYYAYPGASKAGGEHLNYDLWEAALQLGYDVSDIVSLAGKYYYSPDFFGATGTAHYIMGGITVKPPIKLHDDLSLSLFANLGYQTIEDTKDYADWNLGVALGYKALTFSIAYVDSSLSQAELGGSKLADAAVLFTVSAAF